MTSPVAPPNPLASTAVINQNTHTPASGLADRVDLLNQNGHSWMPADMQTTLAAAPTSDTSLLGIADSIKSTLAQTWDGFSDSTDDAVLHKQPSASLALARLLHSSIGPIPVAQDDLGTIQKNLQKMGFGKDLPTDGVWDSTWNSAYSQYKNDLIGRQFAGDETGSISAQTAGHSIFEALLPSHAVNSLVGYAKALPGDARDLAATVVGSAVNTVADPQSWTFSESKQHQEASAGAHAAEWVQSALGNPNSQQTVHRQIQHPYQTTVQDIGTVLALAPIVGPGSRALAVVKGSIGREAAQEEATQEGGVISKSLFDRNPELAVRSPKESIIARNVFGGLTEDQIAALPESESSGVRKILDDIAARPATVRKGILNTKAIQNIPILGQAGPVVGRLADADGLYYQARTLLAAPYQYPAIQAAGAIGQKTFLTGSAVNLGAQVQQGLGGQTASTQDVLGNNYIDFIDRGLASIAGTPGAKPFTDGVNALGFLLHGPLGDTANSVRIGDSTQGMVDAASDLQGNIGVLGHFQRGIQKATNGPLPSVDDLSKAFGSRERLDRFITMKSFQLGAAHYAQNTVQKAGLLSGDPGYRDGLKAALDDVWGNPTDHLAAVRELMSQDSGEGLANRVGADMQNSNMRDLNTYGRDGNKWMDASDLFTNKVFKGGLANYLYGADGKTIIQSAQAAFDHGWGDANPVRVMGSTRQQYVSDTYNYYGRVQKAVNKARTLTAKTVADAQQTVNDLKTQPGSDEVTAQIKRAQGQVQAGKQRQQQIESAVTSGRIDKLAGAMKRVAGPKASQAEWDQLVNDHRQLRSLVSQGLAPGEKYNLADMLDRGVDPDNLYSRINGEPRTPDVPVGSPDWIRSNLQHKTGSLGLAKVDALTAQTAVSDVNKLAQAAAEAKTEEEVAASFDAMRDYGFQNFGLDAKSLGVFSTPERLAQVLTEHAHQLAADVFTDMAPPQLTAHLKQIRELGYKPVLGSHLGHMYDGSLPDLGDVDGAVGWRRRFVGALGLNPEQMSSKSRGADARIRILGEMQRAVEDDPKAHFPPRSNASTVMSVLQDRDLLAPDMKLAERTAYAISKPLHKANIEQLATEQGLTKDQAEIEYRNELARALQIRDIPRKTAIKVLTTPGTFENGGEWAGVDPHTANILLRAVQRGYQAQPNYIVGLQGLETWARSGFWIGDKLAHAFPDSGAVQAFANGPNELVQLRNRLRFTLSPFFDLRRVAKTNLKMSLDGVDPVLNPLKHLVDNGTFDEAHATLNKVLGEQADANSFDNADRYLHQQSIWGLYNSRHYEAYYAQEKKAAGWSDEAIKEGIHKVFDYGSIRKGGQSALERSANTLFFPFSFEKTLIRNTGMYYLDHPQQALLATGIMEAYRHANNNSQVTNWVSDHLPFARDVQKFNGFSHGLSMGQFGGINAPLFNLLLPQHWGSNFTKANLKKNLPIWKDFGQLMQDSYQQAVIGKNVGENALTAMHLLGPANPQDPYRPTITPIAQYRKAGEMRNRIIMQASSVLDYNSHQSSSQNEISWPDDPSLPPQIQGKPVNRTTIGFLVKRWYPAYDPTHSQTYAIQQQAAAQATIDKLKSTDPAKAREYGAFAKLASQVQGHLQDNDYDTATAASTIQQFRNVAIAASETDPTFYAFYRDHYQYLFGPLEGITKP